MDRTQSIVVNENDTVLTINECVICYDSCDEFIRCRNKCNTCCHLDCYTSWQQFNPEKKCIVCSQPTIRNIPLMITPPITEYTHVNFNFHAMYSLCCGSIMVIVIVFCVYTKWNHGN